MTPPADAVSVAVCAVLTAEIVAVNTALVAPEGMETALGTETASLPLERLTIIPPLGAAPLRVTVQESVVVPVIEKFPQVNPESVGVDDTPAPVRTM